MDIAKIILKFWRPRPNGHHRDFTPARRYWLRRVTRNPRRPCRSIIRCQEANSSTVRWYRSHASVREISPARTANQTRSEEHTSELQSLMRISYAVLCLKKKKEKSQ